MATLSKSQIDRLGDRLKKGSPSEADVRLLDEYRRSFGEAYEAVVLTVRDQLHLEPTGRPAKSTTSIIEKLRRESRLSQVQDIAGCRVVVVDMAAQEQVVASLLGAFPATTVMDRRANPSHGYRAVHVIVASVNKLIEIQIRSSLQHLWAELSEKFSDLFDPSLKYGGGPDKLQNVLLTTSKIVVDCEELKKKITQLQITNTASPQLESLQRDMLNYQKELEKSFMESISNLNIVEKI